MSALSFLNRLDPEFKKMLLMEAQPVEQAAYLLERYKAEALNLALECREILHGLEDTEGTNYWDDVCACLTPSMVKH